VAVQHFPVVFLWGEIDHAGDIDLWRRTSKDGELRLGDERS
jgi:hypothetical protein